MTGGMTFKRTQGFKYAQSKNDLEATAVIPTEVIIEAGTE
jgi:hypothetical protein